MMRKVVLIPLLSLATGEGDGFLELCVEPSKGNGVDCFGQLAAGPLKLAVEAAQRAWRKFPPSVPLSKVSLLTADVSLSSSGGAALALALAPSLLRPDAPYQRYVITGGLDFPEQLESSVKVVDSGGLKQKLQALCQLGYQKVPTLLLMPKHNFGSEGDEIYQSLAKNNIAVRSVATLQEAYAACDGRSSEQ